jgi:hypothetical protein
MIIAGPGWLSWLDEREGAACRHARQLDLGRVPGAFLVELSALQATVNGVPFTLRLPDVLRGVLEAAGVCMAYFVAHYLGYDVQLYDGSMRNGRRGACRRRAEDRGVTSGFTHAAPGTARPSRAATPA